MRFHAILKDLEIPVFLSHLGHYIRYGTTSYRLGPSFAFVLPSGFAESYFVHEVLPHWPCFLT